MARPLAKVLIANRGEIACRVIRTCNDLGIRTVAVYSDADVGSLHVSMADEAVALGGTAPNASYLHQEKILDAAKKTKADAIHPGYGFLSENPEFAHAVASAGLTFVGPTADAIRRMGDKTEARKNAKIANVQTVPGVLDPLRDEMEARSIADTVGYPILLKAAAGGGGKGMRLVSRGEDVGSAFRAAQSEARGAFGDERVYLEKYVHHPRHVEIQVIADLHGNIVHLGERECSIQRRHQKLIEETPSPIVDAGMRRRMGEAAVSLARCGKYLNAGTVEFIVDGDANFYFLEMNTRLQVEHPVTELVTGIDIVREQLRIAAGEQISVSQEQIVPRGHAIECRICAEDPANNFFPSTGTISEWNPPSGPFVRVENGVRSGDTVSMYYDPLLAKVITWGDTRDQAIQRMIRALREFHVRGVQTTIPFCLFVLNHKAFRAGDFDTHFVADHFTSAQLRIINGAESLAAAIAAALLLRPSVTPADGELHGRETLSGWTDLRMEGLR